MHHEKYQKTPSCLQEKPSNHVSHKNATVKSCFAQKKKEKNTNTIDVSQNIQN